MIKASLRETIESAKEWNKDKNTQARSKALGMHYGTAHAHLRKMMLFRLVQRLKEDNCAKCGEKILRAEDLSLRHKKPWRPGGRKAFFNLDNITFTHVACRYEHEE